MPSARRFGQRQPLQSPCPPFQVPTGQLLLCSSVPAPLPSHWPCRQPLSLAWPGLLGAKAMRNGCRSWGLGASCCKTLTTSSFWVSFSSPWKLSSGSKNCFRNRAAPPRCYVFTHSGEMETTNHGAPEHTHSANQ